MSRSTTRNLIVVSIILALAIGAFLGAGYFLMQKERTLQSQLEMLKKEQQQESLYFRLEKVALESQVKRQLLQEPLLEEGGGIIEVLLWIEERARQNNITYETDTLKDVVEKEEGTEWIEAPVVFSGSEADVVRFLAILEHLPYLSYVTSVNMSARSSSNWEVSATLRILLFKAP
jgi:hypothetical protein